MRPIASYLPAWIVLLVAAVGVARAQAPVLVKDICQGTTASSDPYAFTAVGDSVLFVANDHLGPHLYRTDGTEAGTVVVQDLACPFFRVLGVEQGKILYLCSNTDSSSELWESDGTPAGTRPIKRTLMHPLRIVAAAEIGGACFFVMDAAGGGYELWRMDGVEIAKVATISRKTAVWGGYFLAVAGQRLYFPGDDPIHGQELWTSDGTAAGTHMVKDIEPETGGSYPQAPAFGDGGGRFAFVACPAATGCQVWVTDGSAAGTSMVRQIGGKPDLYTAPSGLSFINDSLVFTAGGDLWRSDLTPAGISMLAARTTFAPLAVLGSTLVGQCGAGLCRTDGTVQGTGPLATPGSSFGIWLEKPVVRVENRLFMSLMTTPNEHELWVTDGTAEGTHPVGTAGGAESREPRLGAQLGDGLIYSAFSSDAGRELWRSGGTADSTFRVRDINVANDWSLPYALTAVGDRLFFIDSGCGGIGWPSLWSSDGTEVGTKALHGFRTLGFGFLYRTENGVTFAADDGTSGLAVWSSDGTVEGTRALTGPDMQGQELDPGSLFYKDGAVYFFAADQLHRNRLWRTTGPSDGTSVVWDGEPDIGLTNAGWLTSVGGKILFTTFADHLGTLMSSHGTSGSEKVLASPQLGLFIERYPGMFTFGGLVYFVASDTEHGYELYRTDGTPEGTFLVKDIWPGPGASSSAPDQFASVHGRMVFVANDGVHGRELWTSDGTTEGTRMVADIWPGPGSSWPYSDRGILEGPDGYAYFTAFTPWFGRQLWRSDLTEAGTEMVAELAPYPDNMRLLDGGWAGGSFFFSFQCLPGYNLECRVPPRLAVTHGTAATTHRLSDLLQATNLGWPRGYMERLGDCVYFTAYDPLHNFELRKVCDGGPRPPRRKLGGR